MSSSKSPPLGRNARRHALARLACLLLVLLIWLPLLAHATELAGSWRTVRPGDTPAQVLTQARSGELTRFDPARLTSFARNPQGVWVVLQPAPPWVDEARVLSVRSPQFGRVVLYGKNGPVDVASLDGNRPRFHGHGELAFRLPPERSASAPILLKLEPRAKLAAPVAFRMQALDAYRHGDALWLSMASACFGVMLAMALMAVFFAVALRDGTYFWYTGFTLSYMLVQALQTGFLFHPLRLPIPGDVDLSLGTVMMGLSVVCALEFMRGFCDLERYVPLVNRPLQWLAAVTVGLMLLHVIDVASLRTITHTLLYPVLALAVLTLIVLALITALRGSRAGWYFLAGWAPLLGLSVLAHLQVTGLLPGVDWLNEACLVAAALESVVLSVGLADRALSLRRDRDQARELADNDALTRLLNRRAWTNIAQTRIADSKLAPHVLLFCDLDHFKLLNDRYGHAAGDRALRAVADVLRQELHPDDVYGRFGGEEFVALLDHYSHIDPMHVAARLCRRVHQLDIPIDADGGLLTISIGAARQRVGDTVESLLRRADTAMYAAKSAGRDRAVWENDRRSIVSPMRVVQTSPSTKKSP